MFFNQDSTCVLKAKLTGAVAASQLKISVTYRDNTDEYQPDAIVSTNGITEVTLLAAPTGSVVNIVELIKIYNPDTQANTVQILANDDVIASCAVGAGQTVILSSEAISNGLGFIPAPLPTTNSGVGQIVCTDFGNNNPAVAPAGGTWLFLFKMQVLINNAVVYNYGVDNIHWPGAIVTGGTTVTAGRSGYSTYAVFMRLS